MRRVRFPRQSIAVAAVAVTALTTAAPVVAAPALPAGVPDRPAASGDDPVQLPPIRSILQTDETCTKPSTTVAQAKPWTRAVMSLTPSWRLSQGQGVLVAVVDTGVDKSVPALADRVNSVGDASSDCAGHGSFAAGLIAAAPQPGTGVVGVAPQARVLAVRGTNERGFTSAGSLAAAIRTAADHDAKVIYVARAVLDGRDELTAAVAYAMKHDALVVAPVAPDVAPRNADTNQDDPTARPYFPAFVPQVLSVVDVGPQGGRPKNAPEPFAPDLSAPGDSVVSVGPGGTGHFIGSGSSMAAAEVAGAAALVRARFPKLTAPQTADRLEHTAYPSDVPRLDTYAALSSVSSPASGAVTSSRPQAVELPQPVSQGPRNRALVVAGGAFALMVLVAAAIVVVPRGRARSWRTSGN
ncbi:S8 family serine peptidase [Streptomyces sp. NPDC005065]|uniref:S8 family serine peptidase n=1 Tax=Streptomyces sp. NPDC005065 TaxID=3154461 RepID=UPI0033B2F8D3